MIVSHLHRLPDGTLLVSLKSDHPSDPQLPRITAAIERIIPPADRAYDQPNARWVFRPPSADIARGLVRSLSNGRFLETGTFPPPSPIVQEALSLFPIHREAA